MQDGLIIQWAKFSQILPFRRPLLNTYICAGQILRLSYQNCYLSKHLSVVIRGGVPNITPRLATCVINFPLGKLNTLGLMHTLHDQSSTVKAHFRIIIIKTSHFLCITWAFSGSDTGYSCCSASRIGLQSSKCQNCGTKIHNSQSLQ